jgi:hypothetical protein
MYFLLDQHSCVAAALPICATVCSRVRLTASDDAGGPRTSHAAQPPPMSAKLISHDSRFEVTR